MKIIAGLGNPGREYADTKHNVGFMLVDALGNKLGATNWRNDFNALIATASIAGEKIILIKPQTYMNESGRAIAPIMSYYRVPAEDLIVVYDDMDIPVGTIRIRKKGSSGGHNGMKSIIAHIGEAEFPRIRIGIGRPLANWTVINHVLAPFSLEDKDTIKNTIDNLIPATTCLITEGVDMAMNRYNPSRKK